MKKIMLALCAVAATSAANAVDFYIGDKISYAYTQVRNDADIPDADYFDFSDSFGIRNKIAAGVSFDSEMLRGGFRAELEYGFGTTTKFKKYNDYGWVSITRRINLDTQTLFINGYYDFYATDKIIPFIGIGAGWAHNRWDYFTQLSDGNPYTSKYTDNEFAYNLQIGVAYKLTDAWILDMSYRYTNLARKHYDYSNLGSYAYDRHETLTSHELLLGARYIFDAP